MDIVSQLKTWSEAFLDPSLFIADIEWKHGSGKIIISIDGDMSVTIEQCRKLSSFLSSKLDETDYGDRAYTLEVSSPGVDVPLKMQRQYPKHVGRELKVKLKSNTEITGKLTDVKKDEIYLMLKDKKKGYLPNATVKQIAFDEIAEAIVQVSFK